MSRFVVGLLLWLWFISFPSPLEAQATTLQNSEVLLQEISADNTAKGLGNGRWSWTVFIKAPLEVLQDIQSVQYTLHPTFPYPVQRVSTIGDLKQPFALSATGWGTFPIQIRVFMKDGQTHDLTHNLNFRSP
jgi:transcription initiation factor IIF auxiliary subunit